MDIKLLGFLIKKAFKISVYEQSPQTDEEYLSRRNSLKERYKIANYKYLKTSNSKYQDEMFNLQYEMDLNVSKTEYELSKKILEEYKSSYKGEISEDFWNYNDLNEIYHELIIGKKVNAEEFAFISGLGWVDIISAVKIKE